MLDPVIQSSLAGTLEVDSPFRVRVFWIATCTGEPAIQGVPAKRIAVLALPALMASVPGSTRETAVIGLPIVVATTV